MPDLNPLSDDERDELIAYLDGEVDADTARNVEAKMNRDQRVRNEAEALRKTAGHYQTVILWSVIAIVAGTIVLTIWWLYSTRTEKPKTAPAR